MIHKAINFLFREFPGPGVVEVIEVHTHSLAEFKVEGHHLLVSCSDDHLSVGEFVGGDDDLGGQITEFSEKVEACLFSALGVPHRPVFKWRCSAVKEKPV